jgi:GTP:adenosylcobinamide-phosphate guanylyltransferase
LESLKTFVEHLNAIKNKLFSTQKKHKHLKIEVKELQHELAKKGGTKYEDDLNKILSHLSLLPMINENINKISFNVNIDKNNLIINSNQV